MLLVLEWVLSPSAELIVDFALIIFAESKYGYFTDNKTSIKHVEWIKKKQMKMKSRQVSNLDYTDVDSKDMHKGGKLWMHKWNNCDVNFIFKILIL